MAKKKAGAVKDTRPSLEEIKGKSGKYVVVSYRGYESGGISFTAPDSYEMGLPLGYQPKELMIEPWVWTVVPAFWMDDGRFAQLYYKTPGLVVEKRDTPPTGEDLQQLPADLDKKLKRERKQKAWWIATQPYEPNARTGDIRRATADTIQMKDMETSDDSPQQVTFLQEELAPVLEAARIYEERLGNRQDLLKAIDKRLNEIGGKKPYTPRSRRS